MEILKCKGSVDGKTATKWFGWNRITFYRIKCRESGILAVHLMQQQRRSANPILLPPLQENF